MKYHLKILSQLVSAKGFPKFIAILYLVHHNKPWQSITSPSQMWLRQLIHEKEAVDGQRDRFMVNPVLNPWRHPEDHKRHLVSSTAVTVFRLWDLYVFYCLFSIIDWYYIWWYLMMGGWKPFKTYGNCWFYTDPWMAILCDFHAHQGRRVFIQL